MGQIVPIFPLLNIFTNFFHEIAMKVVHLASTSAHNTECDTEVTVWKNNKIMRWNDSNVT